MAKKVLFIVFIAVISPFLVMSATGIYLNIGSKLGKTINEMIQKDPLK